MDYLTLFDKLGLCNFIYYVWSHLANTKYILSVFKSIKLRICARNGFKEAEAPHLAEETVHGAEVHICILQ